MEELDKNKSGNPMEGEARGTMSIEEFLKKDEQKDLLRFLTAGSVDDGKSTLIGRLLFDSKKLYEDQLDALERDLSLIHISAPTRQAENSYAVIC